MIISHQYKFIYIHIPKTAGSCIYKSLCSTLNFTDQSFKPIVDQSQALLCKNNLNLANNTTFKQHTKIKDLRLSLDKNIFEDYYKFAFVRNPWDRAVSHYFYNIKLKARGELPEFDIDTTFSEYIKTHKYLQSIFTEDFDGNPSKSFDFIGKQENLQEDFNTICSQIGIPKQNLPPKHSKHSNSTEHDDYKNYYDKKLIELVYENLQKDIDSFGYTFES